MKLTVMIIGVMVMINVHAQKKPIASTIQSPLKLMNATDSIQYTLGVFVAEWINTNGIVITNKPLFLKGMEAVFENKQTLIPDSLKNKLIAAYQRYTQRERGKTQERQLFASLKDKSDIGIIPKGVHYKILKTGKGQHPTDNDTLVLHFIVNLTDGTLIDDTYKSKKPFVTTFAGLFPGLSDPIRMMNEGSKWTLYIPSNQAYGEKGSSQIPPNSALIVEVELLEIKPFHN